MITRHFAVAAAILIIGTISMSGAAPKGAASGLLTGVATIEPSTGGSFHTAEYGTVRSLPVLQPDIVMPAQLSDDGGRFTILRYSIPDSAGVRLHFQNVRLASDARIFVYAPAADGGVVDVYGPYISAGPVQSGEFWTPVIHGGEAIVEFQFDRDLPSDLPFDVVEIGSLTADEVAAAAAVSPTFDSGLGGEVRRGIFKGVLVEHQVRGGMAVFEGDIILGPADQIQPPTTNSKSGVREGTITSWPSSRWPNGVIPYVIDTALSNQYRVTDAVAHWNTMLSGVVQLVPRTNEKNYLFFAYTSNASYCASTVGMAGGMQTTYLGDYCSTGNVIHEIGHDFGLWHEHTRNDRDQHVTIMTQNIITSALGNFSLTGTNGIDLGTYDYNSIMHYPAYAFSANGLPTIVTIPDGIPIGQRSGLSSGDIAGITQIYGTSTVQTVSESVTANPAGVQLQVDSGTVTTPYSVQWTSGSTHTVNAPNPTPANGQKLVFSTWSDGGAQSHTVTASTSTSVLTANYAVSYLVTTQVAPSAGGTVSVAPASTDGYYPLNSTVTLTATPAAGYCFSSWTGLLSGTPAQTSITMTRSYSVAANFVSCTPTSTTTTFTPIRVRAGTTTPYTDPSGNVWAGDTGFTNGSPYATSSAIANTTTQPLYQTERWASSTLQYIFTVPNGTYTVNLKFAEIYFTTCGQRVFNIAINGQTLATNFDPCAAATRSFAAVDQGYSVSVTGGQINIQLIPVISNPKISAIEILTGTTTTSSTTTTTTTTTTSSTAAFTPIRVNSGGPAVTDALGQVWAADTGYQNGNPYSTSSPIANTTTPALYQSERWSSSTLQYIFNVPNATYTVKLKFAEIYFTSCGLRVFNIVINGQTVESNFDPCSAATSSFAAVDRSYSISVTNGQINIQLVPLVSNPKISAIEILAGGTTTTTPVTTFAPIRVNSGGPAVTDALGQVWAADAGYSYSSGGAYGVGSTIANTTTSALYQTERWSVGPLTYQFPVPSGTYTLTMKFAEIYFTTCGQRVFNIVINGQTVVTNFDPCAAAGGAFTAVDRQFTVSPSNGTITVQFVPVVSNPKVSAIEIR